MNMKAARPAVFFLCAVLLTPAGCRVDGPDHGGIDPFARSGNPDGVPEPAVYTVTFNAAGGSAAPKPVTVTSGTTLSSLPIPTRNAWDTFGGWYTAVDGGGEKFTEDTKVTANLTVYAKWNTSPQAFLDWVKSNAVDGGNYTYTLEANESIANIDLDYGGKKVSITLEGGDSQERIVSLSNPNSFHFKIEDGVTLTLGNNLTLQGRSDNYETSVYVNSGGTLVMSDGSKICDNSAGMHLPNSYYYGGGVVVHSGGAFTMNGGEISGNSCERGAGVHISSGGTITMNGGTITNNTAKQGGGVYNLGTFNSNGGTITNNTAEQGGGVYNLGAFNSNGGTIINNTADNVYPPS
jgi:uncharacterized repeat protein (TIGR02543 family)